MVMALGSVSNPKSCLFPFGDWGTGSLPVSVPQSFVDCLGGQLDACISLLRDGPPPTPATQPNPQPRGLTEALHSIV